MSLSKEQRIKLRRLITTHVKAQIDLSWKGSRDPEEFETIDKRAKRAKERLENYIFDLHNTHGPN